ncbi:MULTISPECIES: NlpC/P60 family protein [Bacillaceae]|uniref:C40 family peptidase n=1 Tax=Bacillaceae TaxID=186817 RepID=UPI001F46FF88|nr:NlpC/P60 family protein [Litchfieldia alkalitelluris]
MLRRKIFILGTVVVLGVSSFSSFSSVSAETVSDLQRQQSEIQSERSEIQSNLSGVEEEIADVMEELERINAQIKRIDDAMEENQAVIDETNEDISLAEEEIEELEAEIEVLQADIDKRFELLKERAASYQKSGGNINYLEVIFGAKSFGDFIERVIAITTIARADNDFIETLEANVAEVERKQAYVEDKLFDLNELKTELVGMQHHLEDQQEHADELRREAKEKEKQNRQLMEQLIAEDRSLAAQEDEIRRNISAQREAERRAAEQAAASQTAATTSSNSSSNSTSNSSNSQTTASNQTFSGDVNTVMNVGRRYIGNSVYGLGRNDPANGVFDCSAFTMWSFAQIGVNIGRSTVQQSRVGQRVNASNMKPGDLVFFDTYKRDGHVGIYIGNGQFIGSQSSTGVAIASMNSTYWSNAFKGHVRRVLN